MHTVAGAEKHMTMGLCVERKKRRRFCPIGSQSAPRSDQCTATAG